MSKQYYISVNSLSDAFDKMDSDPYIAFSFIPLENNHTVNSITKNIVSKDITAKLSSVYNDVTVAGFSELFPQNSSFLVPEPTGNWDEYFLTTNTNAVFNNKAGESVCIKIPDGLYIYDAAVRHNDGTLAFSKEAHRDSKSVYTVNMYAKGQGLKYFINNDSVSIQSPSITIHRGEKHFFGSEKAVLHQGCSQHNGRANIAFALGHDKPIHNFSIQ